MENISLSWQKYPKLEWKAYVLQKKAELTANTRPEMKKRRGSYAKYSLLSIFVLVTFVHKGENWSLQNVTKPIKLNCFSCNGVMT
ncbi:hypothetical protein YC2023_096624 [Brassica napus]